MILEINQTKSAGKNVFEILENGQLLYTAHSTWLPLVTDATNKITLNDVTGQVVFSTKYSMLENLAETIIPFKYLFTGSQRFNRYEVCDAMDNVIGAFYNEINRIFDGKLVMQCGNRAIIGYKKSVGSKEVVSFYDEGRQVGQITKPNQVVNNLDRYAVHFIDGYESWVPVIAFFTVYVDYISHNHSGEINKTYTVKKTYTFSRNDDKYDKDFIRSNFGQAEADRIDGKGPGAFKVTPMVGNMSLKTFWIVFGVGWGAALLIAAIVLLIVFL